MERHPVIVVGAGPIGLAAALDLTLKDVPVLVLDDNDRERDAGHQFIALALGGNRIRIPAENSTCQIRQPSAYKAPGKYGSPSPPAERVKTKTLSGVDLRIENSGASSTKRTSSTLVKSR